MKQLNLLLLVVFACANGAAYAQAQPAAWPARPVRILIPYAPGGGVDTVSRTLFGKLAEQSGVSFIVENRPGGTGVVAGELVVRAAPDGYTLMASALEFAINPSLRAKMPYDPFRDFTHISRLANVQLMLVCHPLVPIKSVRQIIDIAKKHPGKLTYGSSGTGGGPHLAGELFQLMSGARWTHVPFKGAVPASIGVMSGEVDFSFGSTLALAQLAKSGKVRAIGVTGDQRFAQLPEVPTIEEQGIPGYLAVGWYGFYGPAGMSTDLVRKIHADTTRAYASPDVNERLERVGNDRVMSSPQDFTAFLKTEVVKWGRVVKEAKLRAE